MIVQRRQAIAILLALIVVCGAAHGDPWRSQPPGVSRLAFRHVVGAERPELVLAQRVIDREWGPSDDSVYVEVDVPQWRSGFVAASLSAALPGAGQVYVGHRRAWMFTALEAAGWGGWWWFRHEGRRLRQDAAGLVGAPEVAASGWSFGRWSAATDGDATEIAALYAADRDAFYDTIVLDPRYLAGWETDDTHARVGALRSSSDLRLGRARAFVAGLWINHLVAAMGALRAARIHNVPLGPALGLRVDAGMRSGAPRVSMALERRL